MIPEHHPFSQHIRVIHIFNPRKAILEKTRSEDPEVWFLEGLIDVGCGMFFFLRAVPPFLSIPIIKIIKSNFRHVWFFHPQPLPSRLWIRKDSCFEHNPFRIVAICVLHSLCGCSITAFKSWHRFWKQSKRGTQMKRLFVSQFFPRIWDWKMADPVSSPRPKSRITHRWKDQNSWNRSKSFHGRK